MNVQETIVIMEVLKASYPRFYGEMAKEEMKSVVNVWAMMFEDDEPKIVTEAVKAMISTLKYPPTIADIKEKINLLKPKNETSMTEMEAWKIVFEAIRNSSYYSVQNFEKMPEMIQKLVGSPAQLREWAITEDLNLGVLQSNFMRSYKVMRDRKEMMDRLPQSALDLIRQEDNKKCLNVKSAEEKDLLAMKLSIVAQ